MSGVSHLNPRQHYTSRSSDEYEREGLIEDYGDYATPSHHEAEPDDILYSVDEASKRIRKENCKRHLTVVSISVCFWMLNVGGSLALIYSQFIM